MHSRRFLSLFVGLLALGFVGCGAKPPTEEQIRAVVVQYLQKADPMPLEFTPSMMGCNKARVDGFRVIEIGKAQPSGSSTHWPVKVHVQGTCSTAFGKILPFDKEGVFKITQDSFGEWNIGGQ